MKNQDIVVLDFLSLVHPFVHKLGELPPQATPKYCEQWVRYFGNPHVYCPQKNPVGFDPYNATPILCVDLKYGEKYWRHDHLSGYKTGRKPKSSLLLQVRDRLLDLWVGCGLPYLMEAGYEADDWAGAIYNYRPKTSKLALVSVDSDWAQLVDERVIWLDVYPPSRRTGDTQKKSVLGIEEVLERFNNQEYYKNTRLLTHPYDLVDHKHEFGDWSSDRIPAGRLVDVGLIDLIHPLQTPERVREKVSEEINKQYQPVPVPSLGGHMNFGVPSWLNDTYSSN
jgi:5'-3' exonuclease, N-terminal resolvase-like domain